jgi:rubrerythrin
LPNTQENLAVAFAGESQANRKYLAFARQAEKEGLPQIARLFRAAAQAETIHAPAHLANMGGVGTTLQNLEAAVSGETYEFTEMYPPMVEQAKAEGHRARTMLDFASRAERVHAGLFRQALEAMRAGKDLSQMDVYLCPVCGDVEFGVPPDKVPHLRRPGLEVPEGRVAPGRAPGARPYRGPSGPDWRADAASALAAVRCAWGPSR